MALATSPVLGYVLLPDHRYYSGAFVHTGMYENIICVHYIHTSTHTILSEQLLGEQRLLGIKTRSLSSLILQDKMMY